MATPVVVVAAGGLPVVDMTGRGSNTGLPVTVATNGIGIAVTLVSLGPPLVPQPLPVVRVTVPPSP